MVETHAAFKKILVISVHWTAWCQNRLFASQNRRPESGGETYTETQFAGAVSPRLKGPQDPPGPTDVGEASSQEQTLFDLYIGWVS